MAKISLLLLTAATASVAVVGNAVGLAAAATEEHAAAAPRSRLGMAIAGDMQARDQASSRRNRALDLREQAVRAAEARLGKEAAPAAPADAAPAAGQPAAAGGTAPAGAPDQFDDLARIYQAMKPAAAAVVLEQLDLDVQMRVTQKMRERSTAMILAAMTPKAAAALTMALARRRATPAVGAPPAKGR